MKDKILNVIKNSNRPLKTGDLEKITNFDRNTIQKIINDLYLEGKIDLDRCHNKILGLKKEDNK